MRTRDHASDPGDGDVRDGVPGPTYLRAGGGGHLGRVLLRDPGPDMYHEVAHIPQELSPSVSNEGGNQPGSATARQFLWSLVQMGRDRLCRHSARPKRPLPGGPFLLILTRCASIADRPLLGPRR